MQFCTIKVQFCTGQEYRFNTALPGLFATLEWVSLSIDPLVAHLAVTLAVTKLQRDVQPGVRLPARPPPRSLTDLGAAALYLVRLAESGVSTRLSVETWNNLAYPRRSTVGVGKSDTKSRERPYLSLKTVSPEFRIEKKAI